ncbi:MAG: prolyl oligopeptidase family serine peptidase [Rhodobacteraceae bacterium]|nr:prolyl oligopeptidase family serine peptidase [Paracoccaceae bacterium]MBR9820872.1 prolyl oligopeptidase family serine peptidase [Paracoccaceae bacterium]
MISLASLLKTASIAAVLVLGGWGTFHLTRPAYAGHAGIAYGTALAPARDDDVAFHIWYPASPGGRAVTVGGNGVFHGTPAGLRAPHLPGRFPLVVISHGAGGNAGQFGWIAKALAEAGLVVILPNHPGTTTGNASAVAALRVWERPQDITAVLDEIAAHPGKYPYIDMERVAALGFSAGGYTAMALAGARVDPARLTSYCAGGDHGMSDCAFLAHFGVDPRDFDLSAAAQDLTDPRIRTTVVIDPGIVETLTAESLSSIHVPMAVINLGDPGTVPRGVDARAAAALIPGATFLAVEDALHFSFLAECKPGGAAILRDENEPDPLCDDAGGRRRDDIHRELREIIITYLADRFGPLPDRPGP